MIIKNGVNRMNKDLITFYIPKHNGANSYRKITTYKNKNCPLYKFHSKANISLNKHIIHSDFAKAYIKKRSIITNARAHKYNDIFICIDIKDFFQSINLNKLSNILYYELNKTQIQYFSKIQCKELVKSCSNSTKGIAIGLTPSPVLSNIYLKEFDGILYGKLKNKNLKNIIYTRYADDITISYKTNKYDDIDLINTEIIDLAKQLLRKYGLKINAKKTRVINLNVSNHVRITGINITKDENNYRKLTVGRKIKNDLYQRAVILLKNPDNVEIRKLESQKLKGLQSYILSVEGIDYQNTYSDKMINVFQQYGYKTLKEFIDSL